MAKIAKALVFQSSYTWSHVLDYNENNTTFSNSSSVLDPQDFRVEYGNGNQNIPNRFFATAVINSPWTAYLVQGHRSIANIVSQDPGLNENFGHLYLSRWLVRAQSERLHHGTPHSLSV